MFLRIVYNNLQRLLSAHMIHLVIFLLLIATPIFSFRESWALIFGGLTSNSEALTPVYIKGIKDLAFIGLIFISTALILKKGRINKKLLWTLLAIGIFIIIPAFYYSDQVIFMLSGIRWLMPIFLAVFLIGQINIVVLQKIGKILFWLFIVHFMYQVLQLCFGSAWFGVSSFGLPARNPGIFFIPSTAGIFAMLVLFFSKYYMLEKHKVISGFLIPASIFLTASGTAVGAYVIFMFVYYIKKSFLPFLPVFLVLLAFVLIPSLDGLSGRDHVVRDSFGPRLTIFFDALNNATYLPHAFGQGTSTAVLVSNKYDLTYDLPLVESFFAGIVINLGLISAAIIMGFILLLMGLLMINQRKEELLFCFIYVLFSATTTITESYPANLLFAVLLAYYFSVRKINLFKTYS